MFSDSVERGCQQVIYYIHNNINIFFNIHPFVTSMNPVIGNVLSISRVERN